MVFLILFIVAVYIVQGVFWGNATQKVIENKGCSGNWFWLGFFFSFPAFAVALAWPQQRTGTYYEDTLLAKQREEDILKNNGWECAFCHSINEDIISTCACGKCREESGQYLKMQDKPVNRVVSEQNIILLLKEYKELMDNGIITQAEFETKKKELFSQES